MITYLLAGCINEVGDETVQLTRVRPVNEVCIYKVMNYTTKSLGEC